MANKRKCDSELEKEPSPPTLYDLHRTILTIRVGPTKHPFLIHKELLCYHSTFFRAAVAFPSSSLVVAELGIIDLPEEDVVTFALFEHSLYSIGEPISFPDKLLGGQSLEIAKAYVAADKYGAVKLKNRSLEKMRDLIVSRRFMPSEWAIKYAFKNTLPGSPLRTLLMEVFVHEVRVEACEERLLNLPSEFLAGVIPLLMKIRQEKKCRAEAPYVQSIDPYLEADTPCKDRRGP